MARYSQERKQAVVAKMLPPYNLSPQEVQEQEGIALSTLYSWRNEARARGTCLPDADGKNPSSWSSRDKFAAVVETASMNEHEKAEYCRQRGLYVEQLQSWRADCERAAELAEGQKEQQQDQIRKERKRAKELESELRRKEQALAETAALLALRKKANANLGNGRRGRMISASDRETAVKLIDEARANGARLEPACRELGITPRTYQRWKRVDEGSGVKADQRPLTPRPTPPNALTTEEKAAILEACHRPEHADLPPAQIVARLADEEGIYIASESSFYRVLRANAEQRHRGRAKAPIRRKRPTSYRADQPNTVWSWDITWIPGPAKGIFLYLFMIIDIYSRKIVGWEVHENETGAAAAALLEQTVLAEGCLTRPLVLHSDNGSPLKGATMLETMRRLQIETSFSRPRVSNDNPYSEALFRTCKYVPSFPSRGFSGLKDARTWVANFVQWYNHHHRHSSIKYVTPQQRHLGLDQEILEERQKLYEKAKERNPQRWSGETRDWSPVGPAWLNPERDSQRVQDKELSK
ncbi:IS3 family transposase [Halorhodospira halochloris]|nr:IS3 family transposase [Halorhodospira halochloris]MCG5549048.1 IS3 family transposase [Halorhodospira halochloris]